jgi:hypothetical protein
MVDNISYDSNGNVYIQNWLVYISSNEDIAVEKINLSILQKNLNITTLSELNSNSKPISETLLLKASVINDEIRKVLEDGEAIIDEEDQLDVQHYLYNPETAYVEVPKSNIKIKTSEDDDVEDIEEDMEDIIDDSESYFTSYGNVETAPVILPLASYETYIVDHRSLHVKFNNVLCNDFPMYRITIYTDCTIKLNIIGTKTNTYSYKIISDEVIITKLNTIVEQNIL